PLLLLLDEVARALEPADAEERRREAEEHGGTQARLGGRVPVRDERGGVADQVHDSDQTEGGEGEQVERENAHGHRGRFRDPDTVEDRTGRGAPPSSRPRGARARDSARSAWPRWPRSRR